MTSKRLANVVAPGVILQREIDARGWSQCDLAEILDRPIQTVNQILKGKKAITASTAQELEDATGIEATTWLNLESQYRLSLQQGKDNTVSDRGELFSRAPVAEMRRRGWITNSRDVAILRKDVLDLLRKKALSEEPQLQFAARKATKYSEITPGQEAWCCRALQLAQEIKNIPTYSNKRLRANLDALRGLGVSKKTVKKLPDALQELGIRFVIVEHLPKTKMDGATLWLGKLRPVVAMSLRYGRIDSFLFTLFHEIIHVLHEDSLSVDNDLLSEDNDSENLPEHEVRANVEASELLVPRQKLDAFVRRFNGQIGRTAIEKFAAEIAIHPGVVLGQLQHRGVIGWTACRDLLEPVRDSIVKTALTDGWKTMR